MNTEEIIMEFTAGQVIKIEKLTERIKKAKEKRENIRKNQQIAFDFDNALREYELLKKCFDYTSNKDLLEANIYRLKVAEISLDYQIKSAKNTL